MFRYIPILFALLAALYSPAASAEVLATFYSRDFGDYFPHAFVRVQGTVDSTGEKVVDTNYGFTAVNVSPAILTGSVKGMIETKDAKYVSRSNAHFTLRLSDAEYAKFMVMVEQWRNLPQKSYNLNRRNCVHFAMEAAALLGLSVNRKSKFFKKPKSFILEMMTLNPEVETLNSLKTLGVDMPGEDRCCTSVRSPFLGDFADVLFRGTGIKFEQASNAFLHREVACGPDVGATFGEEQIDFGRPAADAFDFGQIGDGFFVVGWQRVEGKVAR